MYKKILLTSATTLFLTSIHPQQTFAMDKNYDWSFFENSSYTSSILEQKKPLVQAITIYNENCILKNYCHCFKIDNSNNVNHGTLDSDHLGYLKNIGTTKDWDVIQNGWLFGFEILESLKKSEQSFNNGTQVVMNMLKNTGMNIKYRPPEMWGVKPSFEKYTIKENENSVENILKIKFNQNINILNIIVYAFCDKSNEIKNSLDAFFKKANIADSRGDVINFIAMALIQSNTQIKQWDDHRFMAFENQINSLVEGRKKLAGQEKALDLAKILNQKLIERAKEENKKFLKEKTQLLETIEKLTKQNNQFFTKTVNTNNSGTNKKKDDKKSPSLNQSTQSDEKLKKQIFNQATTIKNLEEKNKEKDEKNILLENKTTELSKKVKETNLEKDRALKNQKEKYEQEKVNSSEQSKKQNEILQQLKRQLKESKEQEESAQKNYSKVIKMNENLNQQIKNLQKNIEEVKKITLPPKREITITNVTSLPKEWKEELIQTMQKIQKNMQKIQPNTNMELNKNYEIMLQDVNFLWQKVQTLENKNNNLILNLWDARLIIQELDTEQKYAAWHPQQEQPVIHTNQSEKKEEKEEKEEKKQEDQN